jgi:ribosomal protein S18 acetylase RimI-like enzyme
MNLGQLVTRIFGRDVGNMDIGRDSGPYDIVLGDRNFRYGGFRPDHLPDVMDFWQRMGIPADAGGIMRHHHSYPDLFLIAKEGRDRSEGNLMIGTLIAEPEDDEVIARLYYFAVDPDFYAAGVRSALLGKMEERLARRDAKVIIHDGVASNVDRDYFRRKGYTGRSREMIKFL